MATAVLDALKTMTLEEFLALPDDGMERMLIDGVLWEKAGQYRERFQRSPHRQSARELGRINIGAASGNRWRGRLRRVRQRILAPVSDPHRG